MKFAIKKPSNISSKQIGILVKLNTGNRPVSEFHLIHSGPRETETPSHFFLVCKKSIVQCLGGPRTFSVGHMAWHVLIDKNTDGSASSRCPKYSEYSPGGEMPHVADSRAKIGVLVPSTNTIVEADCSAMRIPGLTFHPGRMYVAHNKLGSGRAVEQHLPEINASLDSALRDVLTCEPDYFIMGMSAPSSSETKYWQYGRLSAASLSTLVGANVLASSHRPSPQTKSIFRLKTA